MENSQEQALRYNQGKPRWSLVDFDSLEDMVQVLDFGSKKYSDNNWKKGLKTTEIIDSLMRHITDFMRGETIDADSKLPITGHILCNAMFLAYMMKNKPEFDTRFNNIITPIPDNHYTEATTIQDMSDISIDDAPLIHHFKVDHNISAETVTAIYFYKDGAGKLVVLFKNNQEQHAIWVKKKNLDHVSKILTDNIIPITIYNKNI